MPWIHLCFFLSGLTSLVYEVLWTRMLSHLIGSGPFAVSLVLAVFMGGLGLGGFRGGRLADRQTGPAGLLRLYACLEWGIALYALVLPWLCLACRPACAWFYRHLYGHPFLYHLFLFGACFLLLALPIVCMGATLPVLGRLAACAEDFRAGRPGSRAGRPKSWAGSMGMLYGLNTAGAALGALLCGFWLLETLGMRGTLLLAAAVNAAVGAAGLLLARGRTAAAGAGPPHGLPASYLGPPDPEAQFPLPLLLAVFAVSGFCAMACEVIWTKLLGLVLGPTPYAFTLVLATFILGLSLGSLACARRAGSGRDPLRWLAATQAAAALLVLAASQLLGNSPLFFTKLAVTFRHGFWSGRAWEALALSLFMFPPAMALGAAFPLVMRLGRRPDPAGAGAPGTGRFVGTAYAANTAGGVLGALGAGLLMIPLLGKELSLALLAAVQACGALALLAARYPGAPAPPRPVLRAALAALAAAPLAAAFFLPRWDRPGLSRSAYYDTAPQLMRYGWIETLFRPRRMPPGQGAGREVYYGDGIGGFTSVWKTTGPLGDEDFTLFNSGKADASVQADMFTQALCAHFPLLFHARPRAVMVLGLASGITAGEVLHYPVESLDILEINRQVVGASRFFLPWNNGVLADARTRLIFQDGKAHLLLTDRRYDVIISEPSNPWMAGLSELFSREFFAAARDRMNPGGVFVQFLHSYQMDWPTFSLVGRTFAGVFPNSLLVRTLPDPEHTPGLAGDYLLMGFCGTAVPDMRTARGNLVFAGKSRNVRLPDPEILCRLIESEDLGRLFGAGPLHTDDRPLLEFAAPRLIYVERSGDIQGRIRDGAMRGPALRRIGDGTGAGTAGVEAQIAMADYALSVFRPFPGMVDYARATPDQRERIGGMVESFCGKYSLSDFSSFTPEELGRRCLTGQLTALRSRLESGGDKAPVYLAMASLYHRGGAWEEALPLYRRALAAGSADQGLVAEARLGMAKLAREMGK